MYKIYRDEEWASLGHDEYLGRTETLKEMEEFIDNWANQMALKVCSPNWTEFGSVKNCFKRQISWEE